MTGERGGAAPTNLRIGIDVGGTNTDAVALDPANRLLARTKQRTTADVTGGIRAALDAVLAALGADRGRIDAIMLGTTHATNAIIERRRLGRVAVLRLGAPATTSVPPASTWPADLAARVVVDAAIVGGGFLVTGYPIAPLDRDAVRAFLGRVAGRVDAVAVTGVFSPAYPDQEQEVAALVGTELGPACPVSMSHEIGSLGLLERENATVLNGALYGVAGEVTGALARALRERGLDVRSYFAQNDGTLMATDYAARYPILTIGSGPANSIRGAAFLSGVKDAIVADVGGTSTDLGVLLDGFPRESSTAVEIGGIRTNFRMPDILAVGLGGGTVVHGDTGPVVLGPDSVGHEITRRALVFGGTTTTLTDAARWGRRTEVGSDPHGLGPRARDRLTAALAASDRRLREAVDWMSLGRTTLPLIAVGGAAFLIPDAAIEVLRPGDGDVANAVGAAIAPVSGQWELIAPAGGRGRADALRTAKERAVDRAIQAGADPDRVELIDLHEVPLSYLSEPAVRVVAKAAGPMALTPDAR